MLVRPLDSLFVVLPDGLVQPLAPSAGLMLFSVVMGLALAIAFQIVLANLGIAVGLSFARPLLKPSNAASAAAESKPPAFPSQPGSSEQPQSPERPSEPEDKSSLLSQGQVLSAVGFLAGLSLLLTVASVLSSASFLAVRFSRLSEPLLGITLGLSIWAVYLLLLLLLGGSALGSTAELLLGGAMTSLRRLLDLVKQVLRAPSASASSPDPEPEQVVAAVRQQLEALQGEIAALSLQAQGKTVAERSGVRTASDRDSGLAVREARPSAVSSSVVHAGDSHAATRGAAVAAVPPSSPQPELNLKAAAMSQAVALASTAQTTVSDSWQQVKAQVRRQVDDKASDLLSSLNEEVQLQAHQAMEQVDLSDWSLERLWDWARQRRAASDRPSSASQSAANSAPSEPNQSQPKHSGRSMAVGNQSADNASSASNASKVSSASDVSAASDSPAIAQVNRDLKNYLKYTNLSKLDQTTLEQKLDELFEPWLSASGDLAAQHQGASDPSLNASAPSLNESAIQPVINLEALDFSGWEQALQSRKGIESEQVTQYLAVIKARLQSLGNAVAVSLDESEDSEGILDGLKAKVGPVLERLNLHELSLEDFKQVVLALAQGGDMATELTERLGLSELDLQRLMPQQEHVDKIRRSLSSPTQDQIPPSPTAPGDDSSRLAEVLERTAETVDSHGQHKGTAAPGEETPGLGSSLGEEAKAAAGQVMEHLPGINRDALRGLTEQAQTLFAQLDDSLQQSIEASSNFLPASGHPLQYLRDRLPSLSDSLLAQLSDLADLPEQTSEQIQQWVEETQSQLGEQVQVAQTALESSLQGLQRQAMEQAEQVRHWAAIAAWWLFGLTLSSAIAAGAAGYFAVTSPLFRGALMVWPG